MHCGYKKAEKSIDSPKDPRPIIDRFKRTDVDTDKDDIPYTVEHVYLHEDVF